jgi:hypothetical protein
VSAFGTFAARQSLILTSLIGHRDNAVERLDIAVLSFGNVTLLQNVSKKRHFCARELDRNWH